MDSHPRSRSAAPIRSTVSRDAALAAGVLSSPHGHPAGDGADAELFPFLGRVHPADEGILRALAEQFETPFLLGGGGLARVYAARDARAERGGRAVVLKVPRLGAREAAGRRRFLREAHLTRAAAGAHVVRVLGAPRVLGERVLVLERLERSLLSLIDDGPLDLVLALHYARHAALGLASAHRAGIVHGDVKPGNILLAAGGATAKFADFGLARRCAAAPRFRGRRGGFAGTLVYAAPEVFLGEAPGFAADVYSLGCVIYEALAGEPPFGGATFGDFEVGHVVLRPDALRSRAPSVPAALDALVLACLAKRPDDRPADAAALGRALAAIRQPALEDGTEMRIRCVVRTDTAPAALVEHLGLRLP